MSMLNWSVPPGANSGFIKCITDANIQVPCFIFTDPVNNFRMGIEFPDTPEFPVEVQGHFEYAMPGYAIAKFAATIPAPHVSREGDYNGDKTNSTLPLVKGGAFPFPPSIIQAPLPPFDASDPDGDVHTTPPPDLVVPTKPDVLFMRADFAGVTLDTNRWGGNPPFLVGANSTPLAMLMTPMLALYPRKWQDACLTEHAERGYTHFVWDPHPWNLEENGMTFSAQQQKDWASYLKSWGFYSTVWSGMPSASDPMWVALADAGLIDFAVIGEEVDGKFTSEEYAILVNSLLAGPLNGIPSAAHFTSNYPVGFPRDTFLTNWADYDGRLHLCWQANQNDSAGKRGALLYYARRRVALGQVGGDGRPAPNSRVYDFENQATNQLFGRCDEARGNLQSLEDMYCTAPDAGVRPMSGFGNGCRNPNGSYFHV